MFENRLKGHQLAKFVSYAFIFLMVIDILAFILVYNNTYLLISEGININNFIYVFILYLIEFICVFLTSTKFKDYHYSWVIYIICGVVVFLLIFNWIPLILCLMLIVCGNDVRIDKTTGLIV